jgi:hypothetical protein
LAGLLRREGGRGRGRRPSAWPSWPAGGARLQTRCEMVPLLQHSCPGSLTKARLPRHRRRRGHRNDPLAASHAPPGAAVARRRRAAPPLHPLVRQHLQPGGQGSHVPAARGGGGGLGRLGRWRGVGGSGNVRQWGPTSKAKSGARPGGRLSFRGSRATGTAPVKVERLLQQQPCGKEGAGKEGRLGPRRCRAA